MNILILFISTFFSVFFLIFGSPDAPNYHFGIIKFVKDWKLSEVKNTELIIPLTALQNAEIAKEVLDYYKGVANNLGFNAMIQQLRTKINSKTFLTQFKKVTKMFETSRLLFEFSSDIFTYLKNEVKEFLKVPFIVLNRLDASAEAETDPKFTTLHSFLFLGEEGVQAMKGTTKKALRAKAKAKIQVNQKLKNFVAMIMIEKLKLILKHCSGLAGLPDSLLKVVDDNIIIFLENEGRQGFWLTCLCSFTPIPLVKHIELRPSIVNIHAAQKFETLVLPVDAFTDEESKKRLKMFYDQFIKMNMLDDYLGKFSQALISHLHGGRISNPQTAFSYFHDCGIAIRELASAFDKNDSLEKQKTLCDSAFEKILEKFKDHQPRSLVLGYRQEKAKITDKKLIPIFEYGIMKYKFFLPLQLAAMAWIFQYTLKVEISLEVPSSPSNLNTLSLGEQFMHCLAKFTNEIFLDKNFRDVWKKTKAPDCNEKKLNDDPDSGLIVPSTSSQSQQLDSQVFSNTLRKEGLTRKRKNTGSVNGSPIFSLAASSMPSNNQPSEINLSNSASLDLPEDFLLDDYINFLDNFDEQVLDRFDLIENSSNFSS